MSQNTCLSHNGGYDRVFYTSSSWMATKAACLLVESHMTDL